MDNRATFDDLLQALQSSLVAAQSTLRRRHEEALRNLKGASGVDDSLAPVFTFSIPQMGGDANKYDQFTLPVSSFHQPCRPNISRLTLSFGCELQEHSLFGSKQGCSLVIVDKPDGAWGRMQPQRMQIVFYGTEDPVGQVMVNGELFVDIPSLKTALVRPASIEQKWLVFSWLLRLLRCLWPSRGFTMTPEQSRRIKEIMKQDRAESFLEDELAVL
ncbi:MAG: hypothetical protein Q8O35_11950 [Humidesulfovibrio sp.]|jgi:hypothetical protein|uniref:hypothetical protein n=1 Tax=Humidesulfovibrio sp. TaxID=2910988 RepID=UPI002736FA5B|nr:hypothetical protein [Humidesulfovibrio sp.]MDP2848888.1 hypothetical protein [Humidesulfovibrio sp.]